MNIAARSATLKHFPSRSILVFGVRDMDNSKQLLSRTGEKMRSVKLENVKDIDEKEFRNFIRQALVLNKTKGDLTKNK